MAYANNWEGLDSLSSTALIQRRHSLLSQMTDTLKQSGQALAKGDEARAKELDADYEKMAKDEEIYDRHIRNKMSLETAEKRAAADHLEDLEKRGNPAGNGDSVKQLDYRAAYRQWFTNPEGLTSEMRVLLAEKRGTNSQVAGTTTLGGYTIDTELFNQIVPAMKSYSGIAQAARFINTTGGNTLYVPTVDDTATEAALIAEAAAITVQDLTFGQKQLDAYKYATQMKISWELMQDSAFNMDAEIRNAFAPRFGRAMNSSCTTGTGSAQPNGVVTASTLGKTTASATAFTFAEISDLIHSVDPAYRVSESCGFMFNDVVLNAIKKLAIGSSDARSLWLPSWREGEPDRIEGYRYWINQGMDATIDTASKIMLFGDFQYYVIRLVQELLTLRLNERYADNGLVGYIGYMRWDGECVNTAAIKHMLTA
jgi:HK97 family phage major capsid protein